MKTLADIKLSQGGHANIQDGMIIDMCKVGK